jgi:capsular exopolysaccharide synthesis family protein
VLRLRKWSIVLVTAAVLASTMFFSLRQTPLYASSAKILVKPVTLSSGAVTAPAPGVPPNLETEKEVATSVPVLEQAARRLDLTEPPQVLRDGLSVEIPASTEILVLSYQHPNPAQAQRRTQALADSYLDFRRRQVLNDLLAASESVQDQIRELNGRLEEVNAQIKEADDSSEETTLQTQANTLIGQIAVLQQQLTNLTPPDSLRVGQVLAPANLPVEPASPDYLQNGLLALAAGLVAGVGVAFARERLDDRLRGRTDLEAHIRAPVLAVIPQVKAWRRRRRAITITRSHPYSPTAEAYRTLRTGVQFAAAERAAKTFLVTSPHPGDGKTATTANLGVVLAQAGSKVVVVSADLRKPRLHRFFDKRHERGLTDVLVSEAPLEDVLVETGVDNLLLLASGSTAKSRGELLGSEAMGEVLDRLRQEADIVLLDAPPALAVADAMTLAQRVDAVLFVADAENSTRGAIDLAIRQLDQVRASVIGAVLNNFDPSKARTYSYDYGYYSYEYRAARWRGKKKVEPVG